MTRPMDLRVRRGPRILVAIVLLFAVGGLFGVLVVQLRSANSTDADFVAAERHGVAYLRPLGRLQVELTRAQSAAVRGAAVDSVALNAAVAGVSEADRAHGGVLRTERRWTDLRTEIEKTATERPAGSAALARYTDLVTLANDLARRVGDTSNLILDPQLDSFYLMETALLQLPQVLTAAGRAADHAYLATVEDGDSDEETAALVEVAVARQQVATATDAIGVGLRKAMDETSRSAMGPNLTEPLDAFRSAVDQLAPPAALRPADIPSAGNLSASAQRVREAALPLSSAVLGELDTLLADREKALTLERTYGLTTAAAGVLLGVVLLWWSIPARGRSRGDEIAGLRDEAAQPLDVASVSVQLPAVDARDLLAIEELVHVGRGVRARPKDEAGDAQ
jgi:hypothetical protein